MTTWRFRPVLDVTLALSLAACGASKEDDPPADPEGVGELVDVVEITGTGTPIAPATECKVTTATAGKTASAHVPPCDPVSYPTNPPTTGTHFSSWASFGEYDAPVPWGFLVHSMEHGGVVLAHSCTDCPEVLTAFDAIIAGADPDEKCVGNPSPDRFIVAPVPDMDTPVAAAGWGHFYSATCVDMASLSAFVKEAYRAGPEDFCFAGVDLSSTGWCP